jgi:hypothetical protein
MKLRSALAVLLIAVMLPVAALACSRNETTTEPRFGIYLVDTGGPFILERELIISDEDIASYNASTYEIKLNQAGIEKWNSYINGTPPTLEGSLFSKGFSVRLNGLEIYRGEFWSAASSSIYNGITIQDALFKLDNGNNTISIGYNCIDPIDDWRIISHFETEPTTSIFGLYLVETGELIISDEHIASYNISSHEITLNDEGIEQWNSFAAAHGCNETSGMSVWCLNSKQFAVKIDGEEIYRGSFVSPVSSTIPMGEATITYYPWPLDDEFNTIGISYYCFDPRDDPSITDFFDKAGLLK